MDDLTKINNITSLKSLVLTNNPLSTIPELSLPHLVNLQLGNTYLKTAVFPKSYENCTSLQSIVLSNNALNKLTADNLKSLSSVRKLLLDNAQLNAIEQNAFISLSKTLQSISLQSNSLKSAEFLSTMPNLLSINFDNNKFKELPKEMIVPNRIKHFFFRNNSIDTIDEFSPLSYWMKNNISDIEIYLNNNPFDCCQSRWFLHYLTTPENLVKDSSNLTCASPKHFVGQRLLDLHLDLTDCSNSPFYPSNIHLSKLVVILLCLSSVMIFIIFVVGATLYRRNKIHFRRRRDYQSIQGENVLV